MTRGTLFLITNHCVLCSTGYNGDMYLDENSWGLKALNGLKEVKTEEEFETFLKDFTKKYGYPEEEGKPIHLSEEITDEPGFWNMRVNYIDKFFSDYIFIKNISDKNITIAAKHIINKTSNLTLKQGQTIALCFGRFDKDCAHYSDNVEINIIENIIATLEQCGWTVRDSGDKYKIEAWSPAGENLIEYISKEEPIRDILLMADEFDPDDHARMWIENSGHGQPISIRALIDDADAIADFYERTAEAIKEILKED